MIHEKIAQQRLRNAGLRATAARRKVLTALIAHQGPLRHGDLLQGAAADLDRVTAYRALSALCEHDLAHRVQGTDGVWRYCAHTPALSGCPGGHAHLLCEICGEMWCVLTASLPRVEVGEFRVAGKQMVIYGCCAACYAMLPQPGTPSARGPQNDSPVSTT